MNFEDVKNLMTSEENKYQKIWLVDGKKCRLFFSDTYNCVCKYAKNSHTRGHAIQRNVVESWNTFSLPDKNEELLLLYKRLDKINKTLNKSGFWYETLAKGLQSLYNLGFEKFKEYIELDYDKRNQFEKDNDCYIGMDCLRYTLNKGIKCVNFEKYEKDNIIDSLKNSIENGVCYRHVWRKKYDNSIEYNPDGKRCWYSEEFKNCGNGHYYIMIDTTHAIFGEDD